MRLNKEIMQLLAMVLPLIVLVASIPLLSKYVPGASSDTPSAVEEVSGSDLTKEFRITLEGIKASAYCDVGSCTQKATKSIDLTTCEKIAELLNKGYVVSSVRIVSVTARIKSGKSWGFSEGHKHWFVLRVNGLKALDYEWVGSVDESRAFAIEENLGKVQTVDVLLEVGAGNVLGFGGAWSEVEVQIIIYVTLVKNLHVEATPGIMPDSLLP